MPSKASNLQKYESSAPWSRPQTHWLYKNQNGNSLKDLLGPSLVSRETDKNDAKIKYKARNPKIHASGTDCPPALTSSPVSAGNTSLFPQPQLVKSEHLA